MKAIILAAGYATRLYPLTVNYPKALLEVNKKPILEFILEKLEKIRGIEEIIVVSNNKFFVFFEEWLKKFNLVGKVHLVNDLTNSEEDRLGALGDLKFVIKKNKINADILVIAGDNLFDFALEEFVNLSRKKQCINIGIYNIKDLEKAKRFGVVEINSQNLITKFMEKPERPFSTLIGIGIYFIPVKALNLINEYFIKNNTRDALGHFMEYLLENKIDVRGYEFRGTWFDIGDIETYEEAKRFYRKER
ncbi:MAG: nucleotidyltransferase family protein [Candidatus Omnitrophota bacterium]